MEALLRPTKRAAGTELQVWAEVRAALILVYLSCSNIKYLRP